MNHWPMNDKARVLPPCTATPFVTTLFVIFTTFFSPGTSCSFWTIDLKMIRQEFYHHVPLLLSSKQHFLSFLQNFLFFWCKLRFLNLWPQHDQASVLPLCTAATFITKCFCNFWPLSFLLVPVAVFEPLTLGWTGKSSTTAHRCCLHNNTFCHFSPLSFLLVPVAVFKPLTSVWSGKSSTTVHHCCIIIAFFCLLHHFLFSCASCSFRTFDLNMIRQVFYHRAPLLHS
jgi:hypothetical protein